MTEHEQLFTNSIRQLQQGQDIGSEQMAALAQAMFEGAVPEALLTQWLSALHDKGESAGEIEALAAALRQRASAVPIDSKEILLDVCGTGGDQLHTFNVSTVTAIVLAACGIRIAKHGNRSASSRCGSADLLEKLGVKIALGPDGVAKCIAEVGIGFLFASHYHAAMKHVAGARKALGVRTIFNLVGPLANPAPLTHQLIGVYEQQVMEKMADAAVGLGLRAALVVHAKNGMDEVSLDGETDAILASPNHRETKRLRASEFGLQPAPVSALKVQDVDQSVAMTLQVLDNVPGAARDTVLMNAAAALELLGRTDNYKQHVQRVESVLKSGAARKLLEKWAALSQTLA